MKTYKDWKKDYFALDPANRYQSESDLKRSYQTYLDIGHSEILPPPEKIDKKPMLKGYKFALIAVCVYASYMIPLVIIANTVPVYSEPESAILRSIVNFMDDLPDAISAMLVFAGPILLGFAGLKVGLEKGRPGVGFLALLFTPIGFLLALAARPAKKETAGEVERHQSPKLSEATIFKCEINQTDGSALERKIEANTREEALEIIEDELGTFESCKFYRKSGDDWTYSGVAKPLKDLNNPSES